MQGDYTVKSLGLDYEQTIRLRSNILLSTIVDYQPDLILVDKKPYGAGRLHGEIAGAGLRADDPAALEYSAEHHS